MQMTDGRTIAETPPKYARMLAYCHVIFVMVAISASLYVYLTFVRSGAISDRCIWPESLAVFIFTFPIVQAIVGFILTLEAIFWKKVIRTQAKREAQLRQRFTGDPSSDGLPFFFPHPDIRNADGVLNYKCSALGFVFFGAVLLGMTIYRCVLVATNGVCT
jgi:hypothetical protein